MKEFYTKEELKEILQDLFLSDTINEESFHKICSTATYNYSRYKLIKYLNKKYNMLFLFYF